MNKEYEIEPYISVGDIKFGMTREEVELLFGQKPDYVDIGFLKKENLIWGNVSVKLNKKSLVEEVSFMGTLNVFYEGINILNDSTVTKVLNRIEKPLSAVGFKIYPSIGIALTGFSKKPENKTVSVFSKGLLKEWKKFTD
jgi:hypothetical protein